jgi:putative tricarboxylic transport membrane protein
VKRVKLYCSFFWILFSIVLCLQASRMPFGEWNQPGPGFFPLAIGVVTGVLAIIAFLQSFASAEKKSGDVKSETFRWWNIVVIVAALIAYALSLEKLGFLTNTFLLISLLLKVVEPQTWKTAILGGVITAVACELVFNVILGAQIPSGILGF